jgi:hypothetical protein
MNYDAVDTFAVLLKRWLDSAVAHGDVVAHHFWTYKSIDPVTGQPPVLEVPYVVVDIPAGQPAGGLKLKANVLRQVEQERTRITVQIGGRMQTSLNTGTSGTMVGGFDADVKPLVTVVKDFIQRNPTLVAPAEVLGFAGEFVACWMDQPSDQPFRVKDHEGHTFWVLLEYMTKTKEA